jgi:aryl carrier-like protein
MELEKEVCKVWQDLLVIDKIGMRDDFFKIGGDSILSIQLTSRLRKLNINISIKNIFINRTIENILKNISNDKVKIKSEQGILEGSFKLLPIQKWFMTSEFEKQNHWNQSFMIKTPILEISKLNEILIKLVNHHDILRTIFTKTEQKYNKKITIPKLEIIDISKYSKEELHILLTEKQSNFNIANGPLFKLCYLHGYSNDSARIYVAMHHLIVDAVSWRIIIEDIKSLYQGEALNKKLTSYRQWVEIVANYALKNKDEQAYWNNVITNYLPIKEECKNSNFNTIIFTKKLTKLLIQESSKAYNTEINDLLLTALSLTLSQTFNNQVNHITLEGHGRESIDEKVDISETIGWFTTMYPVKLETLFSKLDDITISNQIKSIKEILRQIPNKGIGYGTLNNTTTPNISFNYLGQFDSKEGNWQVVGEDSGVSVSNENKDHNVLNINGMVSNNKLSFSVSSKLSDEKTNIFITDFK